MAFFAVMQVVMVATSAVLAGTSEPWQKVLLLDAAKQGAVCLDGSPGGYFIRRGDPAKWIVFQQGSCAVACRVTLLLISKSHQILIDLCVARATTHATVFAQW